MQESASISGRDAVSIWGKGKTQQKVGVALDLATGGEGEWRSRADYPKHPAKLSGKVLMPTLTKCVMHNLEFEVPLTPRPQGLPVMNFS